MAAPAKVTWAKTDSEGASIIAIGGIRKFWFGKSEWALSVDDAIASIEHDEWCFFVEIDDDEKWLEISEGPDGQKTLSADGPIKYLL